MGTAAAGRRAKTRQHTENSKPPRKRRKTGCRQRAHLAHVVEPPDLLLVEVLEALPGRPISGERLVRPDGTISLGFYGDVEVAGLTIPEAKEKIVLHMRKYLKDEMLGLVRSIPRPASPRTDSSGKPFMIDPKDTDRVFVDVTAYNSRNYYVEGEVAARDASLHGVGTRPGRDPLCGRPASLGRPGQDPADPQLPQGISGSGPSHRLRGDHDGDRRIHQL